MKNLTRMLMLMLGGAVVLANGAWAQEGEPIKIGVLHSLSGTMAISETTLKDTVLMMVAQQNAKGACWAARWRPWWSIRHPIGRCLRKRPANC